MTKNIETLITDIYSLFQDGKEFTEEDTKVLAERLASTITNKFKPRRGTQRPEKIRPSNLGQPDRKLWFDCNRKPPDFKFSPQMLLNFLYGDICEELMLWLAEQSGHTVEHKQEPVNAYGLRGYMDCTIDGHNVDAKSAFAGNFTKFKDGSIKAEGNDPYGYIGQLSYYDQARKEHPENVSTAYFFAFNKVGALCLTPLNTIEQPKIEQRVNHLQEMIKKPEPPEEKCYEAIPDGKSGNLKLGTQCSRCNWKWECWEGLRKFAYKPARYLTHVEVEPKVKEITND